MGTGTVEQLHWPLLWMHDFAITCNNEPSGFGKTLATSVCFLTLICLTYAKSAVLKFDKIIQEPINIFLINNTVCDKWND